MWFQKDIPWTSRTVTTTTITRNYNSFGSLLLYTDSVFNSSTISDLFLCIHSFITIIILNY
jgi:hypothetical protein